FRDSSVKDFAFKVTYDATGAIAYVTSDLVPLPEREGEMRIEVDRGVSAARTRHAGARDRVGRHPERRELLPRRVRGDIRGDEREARDGARRDAAVHGARPGRGS